MTLSIHFREYLADSLSPWVMFFVIATKQDVFESLMQLLLIVVNRSETCRFCHPPLQRLFANSFQVGGYSQRTPET
jgi:hypothetical protein